MLAAFFSGNSETIALVVSISPAIEAAFYNAVRADLDDGHAADQLRQPLWQLHAVIVRSCLLQLRARSCLTRASQSVCLPAPSTMVEESLSTTTRLARLRSSSLILSSDLAPSGWPRLGHLGVDPRSSLSH